MAARVVAEKRTQHAALGVPISAAPLAVEVEPYESVDPPDRYVRYTAFEAASIDAEYPYGRDRHVSPEVRRERKPTTRFWRPLGESAFNRVVRPGPSAPVVQHTLRLTVRYGLR